MIWNYIEDNKRKWGVEYAGAHIAETADTLADACAKMLICLLENNIIKATDL